MYVRVYLCVCSCAWVSMLVYVYACVYVCIHVYMCVYMCICVCACSVYTCVYVCVPAQCLYGVYHCFISNGRIKANLHIPEVVKPERKVEPHPFHCMR